MPDPTAEALDRLARDIRLCTRCELHTCRQHAVPGDGDPVLPIMFVGEAPGRDEDRCAKPFVGAAGRRLTELLTLVGIDRRDVRVENVVRCRPPVVDAQQTAPTADHIAACRPYLDRAVALLAPRIVVPLGTTALGVFLPLRSPRPPYKPLTITDSHGRAYWYGGRWVFPMFHPAWELHHRRPAFAREVMEQDIRRLAHLLRVETATHTRPWTADTLRLLTAPQPVQIAEATADTLTTPPTPEADPTPPPPGFLRDARGLYITHRDFLTFIGRAALAAGLPGDDPAQAWLAHHHLPTSLDQLTPAHVTLACEAATRTIAEAARTASSHIPPPRIERRTTGAVTVVWATDMLHPMFRTASAIDELMRRATGLRLTRMHDTSTLGTITALVETTPIRATDIDAIAARLGGPVIEVRRSPAAQITP